MLETVEELDGLYDTLRVTPGLTGNVLSSVETVEELEELGFGKGVVARTFFRAKLSRWKTDGVSIGGPNADPAIQPLSSSSDSSSSATVFPCNIYTTHFACTMESTFLDCINCKHFLSLMCAK